MTDKQKLFCDEYIIDHNATRAYKVAYPNILKDETAAAAASRLLRNVNVGQYIEKRMKDREKRTEITQDKVVKEIAKLGFYDCRKLFADNGQPLQIKELDDATAACIVGIKVQEQYDQDGNFVGYTKEYKLADKKGALELLGRHLGMFRDNVNISGDVGIRIVDDV